MSFARVIVINTANINLPSTPPFDFTENGSINELAITAESGQTAPILDLITGSDAAKLVISSDGQDTSYPSVYAGPNSDHLSTVTVAGPNGYSQLYVNTAASIAQVGVTAEVGQTDPIVIATDENSNAILEITGDSKIGFYNHAPQALQTGVAVTAAAIHAALVNVGLITA